ncbi:MAG: beta-ketoacyl-ACP synthase II [Bacteroidales bacterium]|jgi:3-oxoacyl-[acyl-carrier-protein] synthase II|nr:beta-ketoacyl-ACP synthase II [Bacteroidales bacterium]
MDLKRVVVTGIGALTPIGNTAEEYWQNLQDGVSGAASITRFDAENFKTKFACEIKDFDVSQFINRKEARRLDLFTQYALVASDEAINDANLSKENFDMDRVGVVWGTGIGGFNTFIEEVAAFVKGDGTPRFNPFFIPKVIGDIAAGHISMKHGFAGPNYVTTSACASAANALIDSYLHIALGKCDAVVTGGSEAGVNEAGVGGFGAMHAISTRNDSPETASRPFDANRDGFVIGEGAGALILEEYEHAKARGAKIYAEVVGYGLSADAHHLTAPHPEGHGAIKAMKSALEHANIEPEMVDHINTHGTSTPVGDVAEVNAIVSLFGSHAKNININSTKSMTGHLLGAAAAIESIATVLAIHNGIVPPTINNFDLDPQIDPELNFTFGKAQKRDIKYAISNAFGFGGHNTSILFKKVE